MRIDQSGVWPDSRLITLHGQQERKDMTTGSNFWVIGGEFGSMNFHKLVEGSAQVKGPFKTRKEAEDCWKEVSQEHRHQAGVRFSIVEEPHRATA
jgi:hypothetical protein